MEIIKEAIAYNSKNLQAQPSGGGRWRTFVTDWAIQSVGSAGPSARHDPAGVTAGRSATMSVR